MDIEPDIILTTFRRTAIFRGLDKQACRTLAGIGRVRTYPPGDTILEADQPPTGLFILLQGSCRVEVGEEPGVTADVLSIIEPGELFGELSFIDGQPSSARVVAESSVTLFFLPADALKATLEKHPKLERSVLYQLCRLLTMRIRATNKNLLLTRHLLIKTFKSFRQNVMD